jgi:hypothetical protein
VIDEDGKYASNGGAASMDIQDHNRVPEVGPSLKGRSDSETASVVAWDMRAALMERT